MGLHGTYGTKVGTRDIIRRSLGIHCDTRPVSYPGTGTLWRDLSNSTDNSINLIGVTYDYKDKGALVFNGSSSYGRVISTNTPTFPFTISCWAMAHAIGNYWIAGYASSTSNVPQHGLWFASSGKIIAVSENTAPAGQKQANSLITYKPYNWYNMTGVFTSSGRTIYVNGQYEANENTAVTINASINRFSVGVFDRLSPVLYLNGKMSNLLVYPRELTQTEILHNYNALKIYKPYAV